jgi:universal stress protein A
MSKYQRVLMAVDLTEEAELVAQRAQSIATEHGAELHIIHVIEPLSFAYGGDIPMDFTGIQEEIQEQAKIKLAQISQQYQVPSERQHLIVGRPEAEIHSLAEEKSIDLIVIGSHGRHGLALLLGSTANGVLHGASCDVLAVRVGNN